MIVAVGVLIAAATLVAPATPTLDPQHLPVLPAQGFAVSSGAALAFVDLQGRVIGRTQGFRFASENTFGAGMPRLTDSGGRHWRLDRTGRRFAPADDGQLLHGGATVSFVARTRTWLVRRRGRVLMSGAPRELPFVSERRDVVTAGGRALDLRTDTFFKVPPLCTVGTGRRPRWILLCGSARSLSKTPQAIVELVGGKIIRRAPVKSPAPNASRAVVSRVRNASGLPRFSADRELAASRRCGGRFHRTWLDKRRPRAHPLSNGCVRRHLPRRPRSLCGRPWPAPPPLQDGATRNGRNVGRLALLFCGAGVDRAVELVFL